MSRLDELKKQLAELEDERKKISSSIYKVSLEVANITAPFSVGEKVTSRNKNYEVTRIGTRFNEHRLYGRLILKSGELGKKEIELYWNVEKTA